MNAAHPAITDLLSITLSSWPIVPSPVAAIGICYHLPQTGEFVMHPLDIIAIKHADDYDGRFRAAMHWVLEQADRKFDRLTRALNDAREVRP